MKTFAGTAILVSLALAACSNAPDAETQAATNEADEFAKRINGTKSEPVKTAQAEPMAAPTVAQPIENIATGGYAAGTATDPNSACNANAFGEFIGREPDAEVRAAIQAAASDLSEVRFIAPGGQYIKPDPTNPRLNVMIAVDGIIRDIRCG